MKTAEARAINLTLKQVFGLEKLRPAHREVIEHVLGGGKAEVKEIDGDELDVVLPDGERKTFKSSFAKKKK